LCIEKLSLTSNVKHVICSYWELHDAKRLYPERLSRGFFSWGKKLCKLWVFPPSYQVDLDLGNYERFLDITLTRDNNITTGKIYQVSKVLGIMYSEILCWLMCWIFIDYLSVVVFAVRDWKRAERRLPGENCAGEWCLAIDWLVLLYGWCALVHCVSSVEQAWHWNIKLI
jgi:hypothetical protein